MEVKEINQSRFYKQTKSRFQQDSMNGALAQRYKISQIILLSTPKDSKLRCGNQKQLLTANLLALRIERICNNVSSFAAQYFWIIPFYRLVNNNFHRT